MSVLVGVVCEKFQSSLTCLDFNVTSWRIYCLFVCFLRGAWDLVYKRIEELHPVPKRVGGSWKKLKDLKDVKGIYKEFD